MRRKADMSVDGAGGGGGSGRRLRVLFVCSGETCRAQMAEGWARRLKGERIEAWSAGSIAAGLHPLAVRVMAEAGVDISTSECRAVEDVSGVEFDWVVTVCEQSHERCPALPGGARVAHVEIGRPPDLPPGEERNGATMEHYRDVREALRAYVEGLPGVLEESEVEVAV